MKRVIIDKNTNINIKNSTLIVEGRKIPFRYIDFLILAGDINLSTKDIIKLTKEDIGILIYKKDFALVLPINSKNAELKYAQYNALSFAEKIAAKIIEEKIKKGCEFLGIKFELKNLQNCSLDEIRGVEGSFARVYFKEYFKKFPPHIRPKKREKHPPKDVVNAFLSYMYSIVYYELSAKLILNGFDVQISYLHIPFRAHNSLASDLLEFFRSEVDKFVLKAFNEFLNKSDFDSNYYLKRESRKRIWPEIKSFLETLKYEEKIAWLRKEILS
jgi:CRISPR-associated protein Cas1